MINENTKDELKDLEQYITQVEDKIYDLEQENNRLAQEISSLEERLCEAEEEVSKSYSLAKAIHELQEEMHKINGFIALNKLNAPTRVGMK